MSGRPQAVPSSSSAGGNGEEEDKPTNKMSRTPRFAAQSVSLDTLSPRRRSAAQKKNYNSDDVYRSMGATPPTHARASRAAATKNAKSAARFAAWETSVNQLSGSATVNQAEEKTHEHDHDDNDNNDNNEQCDICYGDGGHCYNAIAGCIQCGTWLCGVHVAAHRREKHKCSHEIVPCDIFSRRQAGAVRVPSRQRARRDAADASVGRLGFGRRRVLHHEILQQQQGGHSINGTGNRPAFESPYDVAPLLQTINGNDHMIGSNQSIAVDVTGKIGRRSTAAPQCAAVASYDNNDNADNEASLVSSRSGNISHAQYWRAARAGRNPTDDRHHHDAREQAAIAASQRVSCKSNDGNDGSDDGDDVYHATSANVNVTNGLSVSGRPFSHRGYWQHIRHPASLVQTSTITAEDRLGAEAVAELVAVSVAAWRRERELQLAHEARLNADQKARDDAEAAAKDALIVEAHSKPNVVAPKPIPSTYRGTANIEAQSSSHLYKVLAGQVNPKTAGQTIAEPTLSLRLRPGSLEVEAQRAAAMPRVTIPAAAPTKAAAARARANAARAATNANGDNGDNGSGGIAGVAIPGEGKRSGAPSATTGVQTDAPVANNTNVSRPKVKKVRQPKSRTQDAMLLTPRRGQLYVIEQQRRNNGGDHDDQPRDTIRVLRHRGGRGAAGAPQAVNVQRIAIVNQRDGGSYDRAFAVDRATGGGHGPAAEPFVAQLSRQAAREPGRPISRSDMPPGARHALTNDYSGVRPTSYVVPHRSS